MKRAKAKKPAKAAKKKAAAKHAKKRAAQPRRVTQTQYAKRIGKSKQYVHKLVQQGVIELDGAGLLEVRQADTARQAVARSGRLAKKAAASDLPASDRNSRGIVSATTSLTAARAEETQYKALSAKLDYQIKIGMFVLKSEVLKAEQRKNETFRNVIRRSPREIAALWHGPMRSELETLLRKELDRRLDQLSRDPLGMKPSEGSPAPTSSPASVPDPAPIEVDQFGAVGPVSPAENEAAL